ncbi:metallophosphoesterase family protein [Selenomonas sp.]|uniref:metallophosphoesterase family protein n=1 Tax=Selenomonas sp. TaxID=2053611 RepID=UPI0025F854E8|nr:metallophosphoesterase [Selenomonas sp.]MCI6087189.1 metallophosphoesterase [Selenomonas sp.]MDY3296681.1 metallophosphoesterase [Selenomonas sp.]MDY4416466.1 metallophosphoesterase [Selenomonas sp.]
MKSFSRRSFLRLCGKTFLALGFGSMLPKSVAAAAKPPALRVIASRTLPLENDKRFRAIVFSDSQCGNDYDVWARTFAAAFDRHGVPAFFTVTGDLVDCGASAWHWDSWQSAMDARASAATFVPVMGNHECYNEDWLCYVPQDYLARFSGVPANGSARFPAYYYAFDCGPAHILVLNTQWGELDDLQPGLLPEQLAWMQKDFAAQKKQGAKPWNIVLMHKDVLAYDEPQPDGTTMGFSDIGRALMKSFDVMGIDLVLTGHMHAYRNRGRIKNFAASDDGPVYVMNGRAGNEYYFVPHDQFDRIAAPDDHVETYITLNVTREALTLEAWTTTGTRLDAFTLHKKDGNDA